MFKETMALVILIFSALVLYIALFFSSQYCAENPYLSYCKAKSNESLSTR